MGRAHSKLLSLPVPMTTDNLAINGGPSQITEPIPPYRSIGDV